MTIHKLSGPAHSKLTDRERQFVELVVDQGLTPARALRESGLSAGSGTQFLQRPKIQAAVVERRERHAKLFDVDRRKVVDGIMEAIDLARIMAEPMVMVAGWREVGRLCGYYEPTKHKVDINVSGNVTVQQIQQMSDEDLLKIADKSVIEGTAERVS